MNPETVEVTIDLNQSRLQQFLDCKRKYMWCFELQLVPDRPRWALEDGKAVHVGLAALGAGKTVDEAVKLALASLVEALPSQKFSFDSVDLREHSDLVERMLRAYQAQYGNVPPWKALGIEVTGRVPVGPPVPVFLHGTVYLVQVYLNFRTDRLVNWANRLWLVDHKTAAKLDMRDLMKYEMDLQFSAYVYGASKVLGTRVAGIIADVLVKTKIPQFHQEPYIRTDDELLEFEREFTEMGAELFLRRKRVELGEDPKTVWYKNTKECFRYGTCPYRELCLEDTPQRRAVYIGRDLDYVDTAQEKGPHGLGQSGTDHGADQYNRLHSGGDLLQGAAGRGQTSTTGPNAAPGNEERTGQGAE